MGWSEKYWEDAKPELEQLATELEPTGEDEALGQPAIAQPADSPEKDRQETACENKIVDR